MDKSTLEMDNNNVNNDDSRDDNCDIYLVKRAIQNMERFSDNHQVSRQCILAYVCANRSDREIPENDYKLEIKSRINEAIRRGVREAIFTQPRGPSGSIGLNERL
jgi:hypothetical protein